MSAHFCADVVEGNQYSLVQFHVKDVSVSNILVIIIDEYSEISQLMIAMI